MAYNPILKNYKKSERGNKNIIEAEAGLSPPVDATANSNLADMTEYPIESKLKYPVGRNTDEHINAERLNQATIDKMASKVSGIEGPQIDAPRTETNGERVLNSLISNAKKPLKSGTLFDRDAAGKAIVKGLEDDVTKAEMVKANEAVELRSKKILAMLKLL